jgi:hypothetical protein
MFEARSLSPLYYQIAANNQVKSTLTQSFFRI